MEPSADASTTDLSPTRRRLARLLVLVAALVGISLYLGVLLQIGCNSDTFPDQGDRARMCDAAGGSGGFPIRWWLLVLAPAIALIASQMLPWCRRNLLLTTTIIALVAGAGWTYVLSVVNGNLG